MALKIMRMFRGGYTPDINKLLERKYIIAKQPKVLITVLNEDQGFGRVEGVTQKLGVIYPGVDVSIYKRDDRSLLWTTTSDKSGKYKIRNIAVGLECFLVALDPDGQYNAVVSDKVVSK